MGMFPRLHLRHKALDFQTNPWLLSTLHAAFTGRSYKRPCSDTPDLVAMHVNLITAVLLPLKGNVITYIGV